jgi:hypothetical protein
MDDYYEGKGCQCYAAYQGECCCEDVDWTPVEVYKLREELAKLTTKYVNEQLELSVENAKLRDEIKRLNKAIESL